MPTHLASQLRTAVRHRRGELVDLAQALVRQPSVLGAEEGAQLIVAERLTAAGFAIERVPVDGFVDPADSTSGYPPLSHEGRTCLAGRIGGAGQLPSLHLSGHVDVVPVENPERWKYDPWDGRVAAGRLWGRGAGDMKGGLAAYLIGVAAYLDVCGPPAGDLLFSSVIEEECGGNGMKAVLAAGYDADGTLIGEPSGMRLQHAGVGVIWARLTAEAGHGGHPAFASTPTAADRILAGLVALRHLEERLNETRGDPAFFKAFDRPFRLNIGSIAGGTWPSSEPATVTARVRLGFGRDLSPADAQRLVGEAVATSTSDVRVEFEGFRAPAYFDDLNHDLARTLSDSHAIVRGARPGARVLAGTTDARSVSGPRLCYGPTAGNIHGTDEWVDLESVADVATCISLTIARWHRLDCQQ